MHYNTQNEKIAAITEKTLVVGIDVGSELDYARAFNWRKIEISRKAFPFSNTEGGFQRFLEWLEGIMHQHEMSDIIIGMEPTGQYWLDLGKYLQDKGFRVVLVNPQHVKRSKELDDNNQAKNDRKDPKTIVGLMIEGRYMYPYWTVATSLWDFRHLCLLINTI